MTLTRSELGHLLERGLDDIAAPGAGAALITADGIVWEGSTGVARPSSGRLVDEQTAFLWFSMTKIATATATMQLVDSGDLDLDSHALDYLPELPLLDRRITVRHLLNHSSGIANPPPLRWIHPADDPGPQSSQMLSRLLERYGKPKFTPGDRSAYSNIGYLVLGEVIREVSGVPYKEFVVERVLRPIGATATAFSFDAAGAEHAAEGGHPRRDPLLPLMRPLIPGWALRPAVGKWRVFAPFYLDGSAYGGLVGPVGDAAILAAAHIGEGTVNGKRILSPESAIEMQRIATEGKKFDLGLGWFRRHRDSERGRTYIEHLGGGGGYGTVMRLYPKHGLGVVAMANVSSQHFKHERFLAPLNELG